MFKNSLILAGICFIVLKTVLDETWKSLDTKFGPQWKDQWSSFQVRQDLALFHILLALTLSWNCVKSLIVTKIVQKMNFEETWGELETEYCFQRHGQGILRKLWFSCGIAQWGRALISIFRHVSASVGGAFGLRGGDWALGYNSMKFRDFHDLS